MATETADTRDNRGVAIDIVELLRSILEDGSELPAVAVGWTGVDITRRSEDEVHDCHICGDRARQAFVADTKSGYRWLDVCMACSTKVRHIEWQGAGRWTP